MRQIIPRQPVLQLRFYHAMQQKNGQNSLSYSMIGFKQDDEIRLGIFSKTRPSQ